MNLTSQMEIPTSSSPENTGTNTEKGQSTIEFILTFSFSLGILFLFIKLALNTTAGYIAHYATFMSSRAYLSMDNSGQNNYTFAADVAKKVFNSYKLNRFLIESTDFGVNPHNLFNDRKQKLYVGAYFTFKVKFSFFALVGGRKSTFLVSESYLGKEPSRHQCLERICEIMKIKTGYPSNCPFDGASNSHATFFDNGC